MAEKTVLIADDHALFRRGLRDLLESTFIIVDEARAGEEAIEKSKAEKPDVVVMDISMPGAVDGIEATRRIKEELPDIGVVVVSATDDDERIFEAIQAGATGYIVKDEDPEHIVKAIRSVADGKAYLPPMIAKRVVAGLVSGLNGRQDRNSANLTLRELNVLKMLVHGKRNRDIARELGISERTVGNHITNIYNKLCVYDRSEAILYAIKHGLVRV